MFWKWRWVETHEHLQIVLGWHLKSTAQTEKGWRDELGTINNSTSYSSPWPGGPDFCSALYFTPATSYKSDDGQSQPVRSWWPRAHISPGSRGGRSDHTLPGPVHRGKLRGDQPDNSATQKWALFEAFLAGLERFWHLESSTTNIYTQGRLLKSSELLEKGLER